MILIACSHYDPVSRNVCKLIIDHNRCRIQNEHLYLCNDSFLLLWFHEDTVHFDEKHLVSIIDRVTTIIIPSRHEMQRPQPVFTVHVPGNPGPNARYGGKPYELALADPVMMWLLLRNMEMYRHTFGCEEFDVVYESTHHGPTSIPKPITFIEIGSTSKEWYDNRALNVLMYSILRAVEEYPKSTDGLCIPCVGFGGKHYQSEFTKRALKYCECYGHMISRDILYGLDDESRQKVVSTSIARTLKVRRVVVEKMRASVREVIEKLAQAQGLEVVKI